MCVCPFCLLGYMWSKKRKPFSLVCVLPSCRLWISEWKETKALTFVTSCCFLPQGPAKGIRVNRASGRPVVTNGHALLTESNAHVSSSQFRFFSGDSPVLWMNHRNSLNDFKFLLEQQASHPLRKKLTHTPANCLPFQRKLCQVLWSWLHTVEGLAYILTNSTHNKHAHIHNIFTFYPVTYGHVGNIGSNYTSLFLRSVELYSDSPLSAWKGKVFVPHKIQNLL